MNPGEALDRLQKWIDRKRNWKVADQDTFEFIEAALFAHSLADFKRSKAVAKAIKRGKIAIDEELCDSNDEEHDALCELLGALDKAMKG